jgi:D-glycero-D-manno-heptose 1,7-bisphosphate phosphatase
MQNRAVFLDRDNTLVFDPGYLSNVADVHLIDGVIEGLELLVRADFKLIIVTNQSGVARGYFDESSVSAVNAEVVRQLSASGISINAVYYCPYHPDGILEPFNQNHFDRKPNPGMLLRAAGDLDIVLSESWMIGDHVHDSEAGKRAGCRTIRIPLLQTQMSNNEVFTDFICSNMLEAAKIIVGNL